MAKRKTTAKKPTRKRKKNYGLMTYFLVALGIIIVGFVVNYAFKEKKKKAAIKKTHQLLASIPKGYQALGIDVSHHQGKIDWVDLFHENGYDTIIDFVYCKATEGSDHIDTEWKRNRLFLNSYGVANGAYHFFNPTSDPIEQAEHFLTHWKARSIDLPPVLDVERLGRNDSELIANIIKWCEFVEAESGLKPIIYTSRYYFESKFKQKLTNYQFWIASYTNDPQIKPLNNVVHWQFTDKGTIPGVKGNVDLNVSKIAF